MPVPQSTGPATLIAPYFYMEDANSKWCDLNFKLLQSCIEERGSSDVSGQVVIGQRYLEDPKDIDKLAVSYRTTGCENFYLWVDGFSEHSATVKQLEAYIYLLKSFSMFSTVTLLYGGFFSVALSRAGVVSGISGVTHSMEHGESRAVVPVGGGIPVSKYYLPTLHSRLHFRDALRAIRQMNGFTDKHNFHSKICGCAECRSIIKEPNLEDSFGAYGDSVSVSYKRGLIDFNREFPTQETKKKSLRHYLLAKSKEYEAARYSSINSIVAELTQTHRALSKTLSSDSIKHCLSWTKALQSETR